MRDLLHDGGMQAAFVAALILSVGSFTLRRFAAIHITWAWVALTGSLIGLSTEARVEPGIVWGVVLLVGAAVVARSRGGFLFGVACTPGAWAFAQAMPPDAPTWMRAALVVALGFAVPLVCSTERALPPRVTPLLVLGSAWGVFVCVPETGPVHSLLGALVPAAVLGVLVEWRPDPIALAPLLGVLAWTAAAGGAARPGAVVGGLACFGVLVLVPATPRAPVPVVVAVDVGLVLFVARVAGFRHGAAVALALSAMAFAVAAAMLLIGQRVAASVR